VLTFWKLELSKAMDHSQREGVFASVSTSSMTNSFGIVVHGFNDSVINSKIEIGEDSFLMTSEHPGKISEGFEATMSCPPEPTLQILCCPGFSRIIPQSSEHLFEEVCPDDLEAAFKKLRKRDLLVLCKVPGIFQPDVFGPFEGFTAHLGQGLGLHFAHLVNSLHEMANDMEFIKHGHGIAAILMNDIDVVLPHVTTDSLNSGSACVAPPLKEPPQGVLIPVSATPYEAFSLQIIHIGVVGVPFLSADLIDANESDSLVIFPFSPIFNGSLYRASDRIPGDIEKSGYLVPRQQSSPERKDRDKGETESSFPHAPRDTFHLHTMLAAFDPSGPVVDKNGDTPQRDVAPSPLFEDILAMIPFFTDAAWELSSFFGIQDNPQFFIYKFDRNNTMILDSKSETYDTFYEHESPPLSGIWGNTLTNGFGSCFQLLSPFIGHRFS